MDQKRICVLFCVLTLTVSCDGSKILGIFPTSARSHYILGSSLMRGLAEAGHDVTMISPYSEKDPPKNGTYRDIVLTGFVEEYQEMVKYVVKYEAADQHPLRQLSIWIRTMSPFISEKTFNHTSVQKLMRSGEKFDVVIVAEFLIDAVKALATLFDAHLILFSSIAASPGTNSVVGNPSLPSMIPETMSNFPPKMTFFQRLKNTLTRAVFSAMINFIQYPGQREIVKKYFAETVNFDDILHNASLVLLNSHVSITNPRPHVPCMIEIGGFHISPPKSLPDDLQSFLDSAEDGAIYMSMGSHIKSKDMPAEKREAILKAFSKLKQKVLWKWEDDVLPGQPANVMLGKWLPQQDILAHPNVKLFITHGGLLSTTETIYHGVPIIAIPVFGDQKMNADAAEQAGYGVVLQLKDISEDKLSSLLNEVLNNPKYRQEAQRRSRIMKDRQVSPMDTAVYWVEYVIRHNGAKHLKVAYLDLAWYQYYLLDVFAFILAVLYGTYLLLKKTFLYIFRSINRHKKEKPKQN